MIWVFIILAKNTGIDVATCLQLMSGLAGAKIVKG